MKKNRFYLLWLALVITALIVIGLGVWVKYMVLLPQGMYQDKGVGELVMLYIADEEVRQAVHEGLHGPEQTDPPETTEDVTVDTTESVTVDTTETTTEETTEPATETTTVPITEPPITAMDDEWFEDVLFIGDSRTVALQELARSGNADYFCSVGNSVFKTLKITASDLNFSEQTLEQLLSSRTYGKVFIALGINECGYPLSMFLDTYQALIDVIRQYQPEAKIILHSIMTVGRGKAAEADYFSIANLQRFNDEIMALADGESIFYIDVNEAFADEEGYLPSEMSGDGCHLYGKYDVLWEQWIREACTSLGI